MLIRLLTLGYTVLRRFIRSCVLKNTRFINKVYRSLRLLKQKKRIAQRQSYWLLKWLIYCLYVTDFINRIIQILKQDLRQLKISTQNTELIEPVKPQDEGQLSYIIRELYVHVLNILNVLIYLCTYILNVLMY